LGDAPTHDRAQVEGDLLDASRTPRTPAVTDDLAPQSLVVGQPVRPRDGGGLGPHRLMSEGHPRPKGPVEQHLCSKAFQRGQVQRLKRGIAHAVEGHQLLSSVKGPRETQQFLLLEGSAHPRRCLHPASQNGRHPNR